MTARQVSRGLTLDNIEHCAGIADHHQFAVFVIIANVAAHVWLDGKAQEALASVFRLLMLLITCWKLLKSPLLSALGSTTVQVSQA